MPMMGLTDDFRERRKNSAEPYMLPWSVIATAGIWSRSTSSNNAPTLAAPSSIEYSV